MSEYNCPDCDTAPYSGDGFYYVDSGEVIDCTEVAENGLRLIAKPPPGKKAYPLRSDITYNHGVAMEFGGNPVSWVETHICAVCEKEFDFTNCNY